MSFSHPFSIESCPQLCLLVPVLRLPMCSLHKLNLQSPDRVGERQLQCGVERGGGAPLPPIPEALAAVQ